MITVKEFANRNDFYAFVNDGSDAIKIIKIGAPWCGPCKVLSKTIQNLDEDKINGALFGEVDIDEFEDTDEITEKYGIRNVPTMLYFKNGDIMKRTIGGQSATDIYNAIEEIN